MTIKKPSRLSVGCWWRLEKNQYLRERNDKIGGLTQKASKNLFFCALGESCSFFYHSGMNEQRSPAPSCSSHWSGNGGLQSVGFLPGFVGNPWWNEEEQSKSPPSIRNVRHTCAQDLHPHMAPKRCSASREVLGGLYNDPSLVKNKSRQASCCSQTGHAVHI